MFLFTEEIGRVCWNKDKEKVDNVVENGYNIATIWQYD